MAKQKKEKKVEAPPVKPVKATAWRTTTAVYAFVVYIFSFALYFNTIFNDYNMDDELVTVNHRITSQGWEVIKFNSGAFSSDALRDSSLAVKFKYFLPTVFRVPYYEDKAGYKYEYRPMVLLSFAVEHMLFGGKEVVNGAEVSTDSPHISHIINVVLYSLLCVLLFYLLITLLKRYNYNHLFALIIALLFAAHPIHTEIVASIKNRDEILALIFALLSLWFSIAFAQQKKAYFPALVFIFFLFGILSKPTIITFAVLIPLSVIIFTECTFMVILLLDFVLIIPTVFYARLFSVTQQLVLALALFSASIFFYVLKTRMISTGTASAWLKAAYHRLKSRSQPMERKETGLDFRSLQKPGIIFAIASALLLQLGISIWGNYVNNPWLELWPVLFLGLWYVFAGDELKFVLITPICAATLFVMAGNYSFFQLLETGLMFFLTAHIFSGDKKTRIAGVVNYLVAAGIMAVAHHSLIFIAIFCFAGFFNKKLFPVSVIILLAIVGLTLSNLPRIIHGVKSPIPTVMIWSFTIITFIFLRRQMQKLMALFGVLSLLLVAGYFVAIKPLSGQSSTIGAIRGNYYKLNGLKAVDLTPVESVRPLKYIEYPIESNDSRSIITGTSMLVLGKYLKMVFIPYPMSYYYGYPYFSPVKITEPWPMFVLFVHLALLAAGLFLFRKKPLVSFSILFYLISISVFSNLIMPVAGLAADRYLLIPSIGFCILLAWAIAFILKVDMTDAKWRIKNLPQQMKLTVGGILFLYSVVTFSRNLNWRDRITLFRHDITVVENSAQAQNLLGLHLFIASNKETDPVVQKQLREEAIPHFKRAIELYPKFLNASYDLGRTYEALRNFDEAYQQYAYTLTVDTSFYAPYWSMAVIQDNKGNLEDAVKYYRLFLKKYPMQMEGYANLSFAYYRLKQYDNAISTSRSSLRLAPHSANPLINIAKTYVVMNERDSALYYFERASLLEPNDPNIKAAIEQLRKK